MDIHILPSMPTNTQSICLTLMHKWHGGWKSKGKALYTLPSFATIGQTAQQHGVIQRYWETGTYMHIYEMHSPWYQSSPDFLKLSNKPTEFLPGNIARITASAISPGVPAPTKTNKVARLAPCSMSFRSWWGHIGRSFLHKSWRQQQTQQLPVFIDV